MAFLVLERFTSGLVAAALLGLGSGPARARGDLVQGKLVYERTCQLCHGVSGRGNGPASVALNVKPMDFTDGRRMAKISAETRLKAVRQGGSSVGASGTMPAFRAALTPSEIDAVLAFIATTFVVGEPGSAPR